MKEDRVARELARIDEMQRRAQQLLAEQEERANRHFDQARQRIRRHYGAGPSNSQQRIIEAALQLLDEDGLNNLTLRKLAGRLDMKAPALYWHFKSKEALIDYMAEEILRQEFHDLAPRKDDEPWESWLIAMCVRLRKAMLAHRDGARVVAGAHLYPAVTLMKLFEAAMESLIAAGVELRRANLIIMTAIHFVFGNAIEEQSQPQPEEIESFMGNSEIQKQYPYMMKSIRRILEAEAKGYDQFEDALKLIVHI